MPRPGAAEAGFLVAWTLFGSTAIPAEPLVAAGAFLAIGVASLLAMRRVRQKAPEA